GAALAGEGGVPDFRADRAPPLPAVADERADLALREDRGLRRVRLVAGLVRPGQLQHDGLQLRQARDRLRRVQRALPAVVAEARDAAAVVVDEGHGCVPVLAGEVEGRGSGVLA